MQIVGGPQGGADPSSTRIGSPRSQKLAGRSHSRLLILVRPSSAHRFVLTSHAMCPTDSHHTSLAHLAIIWLAVRIKQALQNSLRDGKMLLPVWASRVHMLAARSQSANLEAIDRLQTMTSAEKALVCACRVLERREGSGMWKSCSGCLCTLFACVPDEVPNPKRSPSGAPRLSVSCLSDRYYLLCRQNDTLYHLPPGQGFLSLYNGTYRIRSKVGTLP